MSHETAKELHQAAQTAGQQFEYFLTGAIGAMFAYLAQNYTPHKLAFTPSTLEPLGLLCLAGAFYCGLKRIECIYHSLGINFEKHQSLGDAQAAEDGLRKIMNEPTNHAPRPGLTIESIRNHALAYRKRAQSADPLMDALDTKVSRFYSWRNRLMTIGFLCFVVAKILTPYF